MRDDRSHCTFYRAQNTSARIIALLRTDSHATSDELELARLLRGLGPECEHLYDELTARAALDHHDLDELDARLRAQLELAEEKLPGALDELEQYLFHPICQEQMLAQELDEIGLLRGARRAGTAVSETGNVHERARQSQLCGLALSGGGIRSATFNLGLLQGMAKHGVLPDVDYLSMVSGGGYIGGWLTAWIKRDGFDTVENCLADEESSPRGQKTSPIAFLRDYASYLTPQTGLFSADTWTAFMTWARNTFLNLIILLSGLSALLLIPRLLKSSQIGLQHWLRRILRPSHYPEESLMLIAVVCEVIIIVHASRNMRQFNKAHEDDGRATVTPAFGYTPRKIQNWIILPALFAAALGSARLWGLAVELGFDRAHHIENGGLSIHLLGLSGMVAACFVLLAWLQWRGGFVECYLRERRRSAGQLRKARFLCFFLPLVVATLKAALLWGVYLLFQHVYKAYPCTRSNAACTADSIAVTCGTPVLLIVFAICLSVHMGLMGRNLPDDRREWWSRIAAYLGIYAVGISAIFAVTFFGKDVIAGIARIPGGWVSPACGWILTTAGASSSRTEKKQKRPAPKKSGKPPSLCARLLLCLRWFLSQAFSSSFQRDWTFCSARPSRSYRRQAHCCQTRLWRAWTGSRIPRYRIRSLFSSISCAC